MKADQLCSSNLMLRSNTINVAYPTTEAPQTILPDGCQNWWCSYLDRAFCLRKFETDSTQPRREAEHVEF